MEFLVILLFGGPLLFLVFRLWIIDHKAEADKTGGRIAAAIFLGLGVFVFVNNGISNLEGLIALVCLVAFGLAFWKSKND